MRLKTPVSLKVNTIANKKIATKQRRSGSFCSTSATMNKQAKITHNTTVAVDREPSTENGTSPKEKGRSKNAHSVQSKKAHKRTAKERFLDGMTKIATPTAENRIGKNWV